MVDLLSRASAPRPGSTTERVPPPGWLAGLVAGAAMSAAGVLAAVGLAAAAWLGGDGATMTGALRVGADGWLLAHGSQLRIDGGTVTVIPLGVTLVVAWLAYRGGRWAGRTAGISRPVDAAGVAATYACAYTSGVLVVCLAVSDPSAELSVVRAVTISAALTLCAAGLGAIRQVDDWDSIVARIPDELRATGLGAVAGTLALLVCATLVVLASLLVHVGELRDLLVALEPGLVGGLVLAVVCLAILPNVALLSVAVLLGPGIAIGTGTSVTLSEVTVGPLPAVPWFAAVPSSGSQPAALSVLAALPLVCGVVAGAMAVRRYPVFGYDRAALRGVLSGIAGGLLVAGLVAVSGGSIGPGRMADVGPDRWACLAVAVMALGIGGLVGGVGVRLLLGRRKP
jgi:Family of unknown function (DUF6350)